MRRYLLDTGIAGDFINHRRGVDRRAVEARNRGFRIGTCLPVLGELFAGVENSVTRDANMKKLKAGLKKIVCWPFNRAAAEEFGRLYAKMRKIGRPIQAIDLQIAAIALSLGSCAVVTSDTDFAAVPGLAIENWAD